MDRLRNHRNLKAVTRKPAPTWFLGTVPLTLVVVFLLTQKQLEKQNSATISIEREVDVKPLAESDMKPIDDPATSDTQLPLKLIKTKINPKDEKLNQAFIKIRKKPSQSYQAGAEVSGMATVLLIRQDAVLIKNLKTSKNEFLRLNLSQK